MNTPEDGVLCPVCQSPLAMRLVKGRKSGKPFIMFVCPHDGRHFRGFITAQDYVSEVLGRVKERAGGGEGT